MTTPPASAANVIADIPYSRIPGFRPLRLDLHLPRPDGSLRPAILFLHGGGWLVGSRQMFCHFPYDETFGRLTKAGWVVAAADYRLSSEATFPAQLDDARAALAWLREHAAEYDVDPERVAVWGESAGGQLASLLGLDPDLALRAAVDWYAPTDLFEVPFSPTPAGPPSREARLLGSEPSDDPELTRSASPLHCVRPGAAPFLIAHGLADEAIPVEQSIAFADALRAVGTTVDVQLVPGCGHIWKDLEDSDIVMSRAIDFLDEHARR